MEKVECEDSHMFHQLSSPLVLVWKEKGEKSVGE